MSVSSVKSITLRTINLPSVNVPVLSIKAYLIVFIFSREVLFWINKPFLAEILVRRETTSGTARPKACGHAITKTETARSRAKLKLELIVQKINEKIPTISAA